MHKQRKVQKLTISRETLRHLTKEEGARVAGGTGITCIHTCQATCHDSCIEYQTCPEICTCNNTSIG
jgi:hypothetical protein